MTRAMTRMTRTRRRKDGRRRIVQWGSNAQASGRTRQTTSAALVSLLLCSTTKLSCPPGETATSRIAVGPEDREAKAVPLAAKVVGTCKAKAVSSPRRQRAHKAKAAGTQGKGSEHARQRQCLVTAAVLAFGRAAGAGPPYLAAVGRPTTGGGPCAVQTANMGHRVSGCGNSSWCPEFKVWTTQWQPSAAGR